MHILGVNNPMSAINSVTVWPACEFAVSSDIDSKLIIVSRDVMEELLGAEGEVSSVEVRFIDGTPEIKRLRIKKELSSRLDTGFSIFGSLRMLIIEKEEDIATLRAMGSTPSTIRRVFTLEGWLITVTGMLAGLALGYLIALILSKNIAFE